MIRALWVALVVAAATAFYGGRAIVLSLRGRRGGMYAELTRSWARTILRASAVRVRTHGIEHVAPDRPVIVVSNHISGYDVFALAATVPGRFRFVAKKELERIPFFGTAWKAAGHISIDRSNRQKAMASLRTAGEAIRAEGGAVIIFPEGTRSRNGALQPFKKGAFVLALEAGVPLVPTVVRGSERVVRPGSIAIRPTTIDLFFDAPITAAGVGTGAADALAERVRGRMLTMLGECELPRPGER